jgi:site-specific recombinase XerD
MSQKLVPIPERDLARADFEWLPAAIGRAGEAASWRFIEFFAATIRNRNTRAAYAEAVRQFFTWCEKHRIHTLEEIRPVVVAAYIEHHTASPPTVKQHLAAIRMLFDFLVTGQIVPVNPVASVRGPKHVVRKGKTPVLTADEMRALIASINTTKLIGLRDRALIALMGYTFARVGAVVQLEVADYYVQNRRGWVRLHEKGGKVNELPCHHNLEQFLDEWLSTTGLAGEPSGPLFPTMRDGKLTGRHPMARPEVYQMIRRRAKAAGIGTKISCHSFRATGITVYLQNGGKLEVAQQMAGHESARTTGLYDRRNDAVELDEVERVVF